MFGVGLSVYQGVAGRELMVIWSTVPASPPPLVHFTLALPVVVP